MNVYILSKCIDSEKGDLVIDLDNRTIKIYRPLYKLQEDKQYVVLEKGLQEISPPQWDILKSYQLAFGKIQNVNQGQYSFISVEKKDYIQVDSNGLMYKNGLFLGKLVNEKEVEIFQEHGHEKMTAKLNLSKVDGIRVLCKGKKIYRIFTKSKLMSLENKFIHEQNTPISTRELQQIKEDIYKAVELLSHALGKLNKIMEEKDDQ